MANNATPTVLCEVQIAARPEVVFQFPTDPVRLARWMGQPDVWDARPGDHLGIAIEGVHPVSGQFIEVDPPRRLVFTWGWDLPEYGVPPGGGTLLRLRHSGLPGDADAHADGWRYYLRRLASAAEGADDADI